MYGGLYAGGRCPRPSIIVQQEEELVASVERLLDLAPSREPTTLASAAAGAWRRFPCLVPSSDLSMLLLALDMAHVLSLTSAVPPSSTLPRVLPKARLLAFAVRGNYEISPHF